MLERAIARTANPPGWYFHLIAIDRYLQGDFEGMLSAAEKSAVMPRPVSLALLAIAHGELGHVEEDRDALRRMRQPQFGAMADEPGAYLRRHGAADAIADALTAGLQRAERLVRGA